MLPGSRFPRVREPITKSCVPLIIGSTRVGIKRGTSLPSPSRNTSTSHSSETVATPAAQARPYPRGAETTLAPALSGAFRGLVGAAIVNHNDFACNFCRDHFAHYLGDGLFFVEGWNDNGNPHGENLMRFRRRIVPEEPPATNQGECSAVTRPHGRA